jgi:hypothetical protein
MSFFNAMHFVLFFVPNDDDDDVDADDDFDVLTNLTFHSLIINRCHIKFTFAFIRLLVQRRRNNNSNEVQMKLERKRRRETDERALNESAMQHCLFEVCKKKYIK